MCVCLMCVVCVFCVLSVSCTWCVWCGVACRVAVCRVCVLHDALRVVWYVMVALFSTLFHFVVLISPILGGHFNNTR